MARASSLFYHFLASGNPFLIDNTGTGNALEGQISKNTATTVVVENGVAGNVATVAQFHNAPRP